MNKKLKIALLIAIIASAGIAGYKYYKKPASSCVLIDSKNDLEVCEFEKVTIILSRGGQSVVPKPAQSAPAVVQPAAPATQEKK